MSIKKGLFAGLTALTMTMSAQAADINVDGVVWDPDAGGTFGDFFASSDFHVIKPIDFTLPGLQTTVGLGEILQINGDSTFCDAAACDLAFSYEYTYDPTLTVPLGGGLSLFNFTLGSIKFWRLNEGDYSNALSLGTATDKYNAITAGNLWLDLEGVDLWPMVPTAPAGSQLQSIGVPGGTFSTVNAFLDVVNNPLASATGNFYDLKTKEINGSGVFADMSLGANIDSVSATGSARFNADSIPEPSTIALLGLGLLGFAGARRKSK